MKNNILTYLVSALSLLVITSACVDDITLELNNYEPKIVVEGFIEQNNKPTVFLTRSSGIYDTLNFNIAKVTALFEQGNFEAVLKEFEKYVITDAVVTVTSNGITDTLSLTVDLNKFPYLIYQGSGKIIGEINQSYVLEIETDSISLNAVTTIPEPVPIDSLWFEFLTEDEDSLGYIFGKFADPPESGNNYQWFTKTIDRDPYFVRPYGSVWSDVNNNGDQENIFSLYHGDNKLENEEEVGRERWYFRLGEKVLVRMCSIDYEHYRYWYTYQQNSGGGGNPFASPAPIESNIEGGLGVWGGYGISEIEFDVEYIEPTKKK